MTSLNIFNPSPYERGGHVTIPWAPIASACDIEPEDLVIRDGENDVLAQIDRIDPEDPGRDELSFLVERRLDPGFEDYRRERPSARYALERGERSGEHRSDPDLIEGKGGIKLRNSRLDVWFNLGAAPSELPESRWYGGAATSIVLDGVEMLDAFHWFSNESEKRALQIDWVELPCPAWDARPAERFSLFNQDYEVVAEGIGPVRSFFTLRSAPFDYEYIEKPGGGSRRYVCRLYRALSLYSGADYLVEDLFVKGEPEEGIDKSPVELTFRAGYFCYLRWSGGLVVSRFEHIPDWFGVSSRTCDFLRYGFATDVHASPVTSPVPGYPSHENARNTLSWSLRWSKRARCVHSFGRRYEDFSGALTGGILSFEQERAQEAIRECESNAGVRWYELIYKPLFAAV